MSKCKIDNCQCKNVRVCTCDKKFIQEIPTVAYNIVTKEYFDIPNPMPSCYLKHVSGNLYNILGCHGCKYTQTEIEQNFKIALSASITSCIYQVTSDKIEYMSDSLDPQFEKYATDNGYSLGTPEVINVGSSSSPSSSS